MKSVDEVAMNVIEEKGWTDYLHISTCATYVLYSQYVKHLMKEEVSPLYWEAERNTWNQQKAKPLTSGFICALFVKYWRSLSSGQKCRVLHISLTSTCPFPALMLFSYACAAVTSLHELHYTFAGIGAQIRLIHSSKPSWSAVVYLVCQSTGVKEHVEYWLRNRPEKKDVGKSGVTQLKLPIRCFIKSLTLVGVDMKASRCDRRSGRRGNGVREND